MTTNQPLQRQVLGDWGSTFSQLFPQGVEGAIAEFGVFDGFNTLHLSKFGRDVYAFDTFEGMPSEEFREELDRDEPGKFRPVASSSVLFGGYPNVIPVVGRFVSTLLTIPPTLKFSFVFVDCDLYESHKQVLEWIPPHLSKGAILIFEDYWNLPGAKLAVDEFLKEWDLTLIDPPSYTIWNPKE